MATRTPLVIIGAQVQQLPAADSMLAQGAFAAGSLSLAAGQFAIVARRLVATGAQRITLAGDACLRIV